MNPSWPEIWRPIPDLTGYHISWSGLVVGPRGHVLKAAPDNKGYPRLRIRGRNYRIHTLMTRSFLGVRPVGFEVLHADGVKVNSWLGNLSYGTASQNTLDRIVHGTHSQSRKTSCVNGHDFTPENTRISNGQRVCKACRRDNSRRYRSRLTLDKG